MNYSSAAAAAAAAGTVAPTDVLAPGVIEDTYSDKMDIMACCRGDYAAWFRWGAGGGWAWACVICVGLLISWWAGDLQNILDEKV